MRKLLIVMAFPLFALIETTNAQLSVSINIGTQPSWGPQGYDHVDNYYLPEIDAYYNVPKRQYTYQNGSKWVTTTTLPTKYRSVDLNKTYKVVENNDKPYMNHQKDLQQYGSYKNRHDQPVIRDAKDPKYFQNPGHPQHKQWQQQQHSQPNRQNGGDGHH